MSKFGNSKKDKFLTDFPTASLDNETDKITTKLKFNFSYFDESQKAGQKFEDWSHQELTKLLNKLKEYSRESLEHWKNQKIGSGKSKWHVLEVYGNFPNKTDFAFPKHIPHQVLWARFRMEYSVRLIGFVIPEQYHKKEHPKTKEYFDTNTFYIVFLDKDHRFYKTS